MCILHTRSSRILPLFQPAPTLCLCYRAGNCLAFEPLGSRFAVVHGEPPTRISIVWFCGAQWATKGGGSVGFCEVQLASKGSPWHNHLDTKVHVDSHVIMVSWQKNRRNVQRALVVVTSALIVQVWSKCCTLVCWNIHWDIMPSLVNVRPHKMRATCTPTTNCSPYTVLHTLFDNAIFHVLSSGTLEKRSANHIFWSPLGQFVALAGLNKTSSQPSVPA